MPRGSMVQHAMIKSVEGVRRFQIVQNDRAAYEIRLVTDTRSTYDLIFSTVLGGIRALLPGCVVDASWHAELHHPEPGRRFETIIALDGTD